MRCLEGRCDSPRACAAFQYCRVRNLDGTPMTDAKLERNRKDQEEFEKMKRGVQPDPLAARMVSEAAELLERFGDHELGDL